MALIKHKRQMALAAFDLLQVHRWWGQLDSWQGLVTLNYHRIGNANQTELDPGVFSATAEQFEAQLRYLKSNCDVIRVADLADVLQSGSKRRCTLITFDDGYRDNYELAFPVLKQVGLSAVIFLSTAFLDDGVVAWWDEIAWLVKHSKQPFLTLPRTWEMESLDLSVTARDGTLRHLLRLAKSLTPLDLCRFLDDMGQAAGTGRAPRNSSTAPWMTWDMVREMYRAGIEFGGHTVTHPVLARCSLEQQQQEIQQCKARIEAELGSPISAFSYPIGQPGSFTNDTKRLAREAGYQWAFSFVSGYATSSSDPLSLRRVAMEPQIRLPEQRAMTQKPRLYTR